MAHLLHLHVLSDNFTQWSLSIKPPTSAASRRRRQQSPYMSTSHNGAFQQNLQLTQLAIEDINHYDAICLPNTAKMATYINKDAKMAHFVHPNH
ncbi:hypothetical protein JCGZ_22149 [Jatropha curcas]|uniref:Uncharacterized protein n=1 Tax=Jatropha curcas TaxID=180498 RepID=A0A067L820_JATCU|nr:hypothetical protein JCGZ_22149 [Jatropha curcas]